MLNKFPYFIFKILRIVRFFIVNKLYNFLRAIINVFRTIHYFKNKSTCSHCRQNIDIKPLSQTHSSQIYLMLKKYDDYCLL